MKHLNMVAKDMNINAVVSIRGEGGKVWGEEEWWLGVKYFVLWGTMTRILM